MADFEKIISVIANPFSLTSHHPTEVHKGFVFRRANEAEILRIRDFLQDLGPYGFFTMTYEYDDSPPDSQGRITSTALADDEIRYWVWEHPKDGYRGFSGGPLEEIEVASRLTEVELEHFVQLIFPRGFGHNVFDVITTLERHSRFREQPVATLDYWKTIQHLIAEITAARHEHPEVTRTLDMFVQLRRVPREHSLYMLGLFAIIESLLTHNPSGGYDSLGHQMRTKMKLLDAFFHQPLPYNVFMDASKEKIWKQLYECRSLYAHGAPVSFQELKLLKDNHVVEKFLSIAAKSLIRLALQRPEFIQDLQKC